MSLKSVKTLSASQLAKKWNLSLGEVGKLIAQGAAVEKEHTKNEKEAREVARDHLAERPDYYKKLKKVEKSPISMKEGISAGPEREVDHTIGDLTGSSRKVMKVDEVKISPKIRKAAAVGMTAANIATGASVYDNASRGVGSPVRDIAAAASGLPGKVGYAAMGTNYTIKGFDKAREHLRAKVKQMKKEKINEEDIDIPRALAAFRKNETGSYEGNYGAKGRPGRSASGAYQYIDKTWRAVTKSLGIGSQYAHASDAPKDVQDAVKAGELKKAGSLQKAVNIHYTGNPEGKMTGKQLRANKGQTSGTYYSNFQKNMTGVPSATAPKPSVSQSSSTGAQGGNPIPVGGANISSNAGRTSPEPVKSSNNFKVSVAPKSMQTPTDTGSSSSYTVKRGDTLSNIAKSHNTSVDAIAKASHISNPNKIAPGQKLSFNENVTKIDEISAELVGKVSNARFFRGEAPSKVLTRAINKKFIESGKKDKGKINKDKKEVKEAVMAMPPQVQPPAIHGSQRAGVQRQVSRPTSVSGSASGRIAGQTGSMSARPNVKVSSGVQPSIERSWKTSGRGTMGTSGGSMSATPKVSTAYSQGGVNVGKAMGASKQTSPVVKGMTSAGREAAAVVSKAAPMASKVAGAALRVAGGPAATAAMAVMSPTAANAGENEKKRQETLKSYNPYKSSGRSVSDYEKQALTPQKYEAPKAAEAPKVDAPMAPKRPDYFSKGQAFSAARKEAGGGTGKFSYDNKSYQTNVKSEPYKPESQLKQTSIKEDLMDTKDQIQEAIGNIMEENLHEMKENFLAVLQEKAMQKLEERKKQIAANYFAQD